MRVSAHHPCKDFGLLTYAAETPDEPDFVFPQDLSSLDDEALSALHTTAIGHFDSLYGDGKSLSDTDVATLSSLTEGIETVLAETSTRQAAAAERSTLATELASRVHTESRTEEITDEEKPDPEATPEDEEEKPSAPATPEPELVSVVASAEQVPARREIRVNMGSLRSRSQPALVASSDPQQASDLMYSTGEGIGFVAGQAMTWDQVGQAVDRRLAGFNQSQYAAAANSGKHISQQGGVVAIRKPFASDLMVSGTDATDAMNRAVDESRLPGGSLVAAGGWCAPSERMYDLLELESRDGLVSLPEIGVTRGGIQWTTGPDFTTIYSSTGFGYTEANDIAGNYAVDGTDFHNGTGAGGNKPCYTVPCPTFVEARLDLAGLCINAGLLQQRGYPEVISRVVRGALVAHDHKMSARKILALVAGSTAVTMTTGTVGTTSPLLTAIELQTEHYRYLRRMARATTLEAIFPFWVRGAIRSDLALRTGVELLDVTDAQIDAWFSSRGINAQYVYDWQPLTGAAGSFIQWPTTVQFLLYAAGTWVIGGSDVITIDTLYDSALLGQNNFTALFTEEGWLAAKRGFDSRVITVPICSSGSTGGSVPLGCDGTTTVVDATAPAPGTIASSSITTTGYTLTISGASDTGGVGLAALPYRFTSDGGTTWSAWQAAAAFAVTGKVTGTAYPYNRAQVRDMNGNVSSTPFLSVTTS
jgi:hypothetical protein